MSDPRTPGEWADKLDRIAGAISTTLYDHGHKLKEGPHVNRQITHDDYDLLRQLAKHLRDPTWATIAVEYLSVQLKREQARREDLHATVSHVRDDLTHRLAADEAPHAPRAD